MGHGEVDCKACHGFNGIISLLQQLIPVLTVNFFPLGWDEGVQQMSLGEKSILTISG